MSLLLHDTYCVDCDTICYDVDLKSEGLVPCEFCGGETRIHFSKLNTDVWGSERYIKSLDRTFQTKADLKKYLRENNLQVAPSADKHHGARNESHLGLGKIFGYAGQKNKSRSALADRE